MVLQEEERVNHLLVESLEMSGMLQLKRNNIEIGDKSMLSHSLFVDDKHILFHILLDYGMIQRICAFFRKRT